MATHAPSATIDQLIISSPYESTSRTLEVRPRDAPIYPRTRSPPCGIRARFRRFQVL